jgi:LysM repeat protein
MELNKIIRFFFALLLTLAISAPGTAQVVVERSKDKAIISGTAYYIHYVKKGETIYSISKGYGMKVEDLTSENPPALYGIKEGQTLRIPVSKVSDKPVEETPAVIVRHDDSMFLYHKMQPGETVYSLSKAYGVSENDIVTSNPGIDITRLSVGAEIAVPRKEFMTAREEFPVQEKNFIFHKVEKGESLSSIAGKYGLSVRELRKENRNVRFPQVGDFIRIPVKETAEQKVLPQETKPADTLKKVTEAPVVEFERPAGFTPVKNLRGSFNVAVLLPFYLKDNSIRSYGDSSFVKGKKYVKTINRPDDWIYPRSLGFVEMYEGILIACDTLRSIGLDINLHTFDIRGDTVELTRIMQNGSLDGMDLIIGPVNSSNLARVASYAGQKGIPVVSPVSLFSNSVLQGNPSLFMANASLEVAQKTIARKIGEFYDRNIVFIHDDTAGSDPDVRSFREKIIQELSNRQPFDEIKFKEFIFYSRSAFDNDSINRLGHALSSKPDNIVIIASEEAPVISETIQDLQNLAKKFNVQVFGYPAMRGLDNLDPHYFFDLNILMYSPYWIDFKSKDVKSFNLSFRSKFLTEPGEMSYAWLGYDIAYYFLTGMAIHGKEFVAHPEIHKPRLLETEFDFRRDNSLDGFENQKLYPVRFTRDYEVKLSPEDDFVK